MTELKHRFLSAVNDNRHRLVCLTICMGVLMAVSYALCSLLSVVTVQDSERSKTVISIFSNQEHLLDVAGFSLETGDDVHYTSFPGGYANITIKSSFTVPISVDGNTVSAYMRQGTVENCLKNAGIALGEHDYTEPSLNTPVNENSAIKVYRVEYKDTQYEESIPFGTEYRENSLTYRFKKRQYVLREGVEGKNLVTYRERYVDGELETSLITSVETVREPVDQLVLRYADNAISPLEAPEGVTVVNNVPSRYSKVFYNVSATGYSASRGRGASGMGLYCGTVAVNPDIIPYGSKLYIASPDGKFVYGFAIATDTGNAMQGTANVDLFYDTYKEASLNWRNTVNVYVIE